MTAFQQHWVRIAARFSLKVQIPLVSAGFGYSCLDDAPDADLDEPQIVDRLRDRGWSGSREAPSWYAV